MSGIVLPVIEQALVTARTLAQGKAKKTGTLTDPRGNVIAFVPAAERVRVGREVLPAVGLTLRQRGERLVDGSLVQLWRLTSMQWGVHDEWETVSPLDPHVPPDTAVGWSRTHGLSAAIKALLWPDEEDAAPEPTSGSTRPAAPVPRDEAMSDGGPVREDLLPSGYRKGTRVWTMAEIERDVARMIREHDGDAPQVTDVVANLQRFYRVRFSRPVANGQRFGSSSWAAWRTSCGAPRDMDCRRWTKVSTDWPSHPDDPKPEEDTRPIDEIVGGTLPDLAPANQAKGPHVPDASPVSTVEAGASMLQRGEGEAPVANDPQASASTSHDRPGTRSGVDSAGESGGSTPAASLGLPDKTLPLGVPAILAGALDQGRGPNTDASPVSLPGESSGSTPLPPESSPVVSGGGVADVSHAASGPTPSDDENDEAWLNAPLTPVESAAMERADALVGPARDGSPITQPSHGEAGAPLAIAADGPAEKAPESHGPPLPDGSTLVFDDGVERVKRDGLWKPKPPPAPEDDADELAARVAARWSTKVYTLGDDEDIDVPCALCGLGIESGDRYVDGTKAPEHAHSVCVKQAAEGKDPKADDDFAECAACGAEAGKRCDERVSHGNTDRKPILVPSPEVVSLVGKVAEGVLAVADLRGQKRAKVLADAAAKPVAIEVVKRGGGVCPSCPVQFRKGDAVEVRGGKRHHVQCPKGIDPREVTT